MYPKLNAILAGLHQRHISSFLVTNAQFPEQLRYALLSPLMPLHVNNAGYPGHNTDCIMKIAKHQNAFWHAKSCSENKQQLARR